MQVTVNGECREIRDGTSVAELLGELQLNRRRLAVEINCEVLPQERYSLRLVAPGDEIEIVHFIGGG